MGLLLLEVGFLEPFSPGVMKVNFSDEAEVGSIGVSTEKTLTPRKCMQSREGRHDKDVGKSTKHPLSPAISCSPLRAPV